MFTPEELAIIADASKEVISHPDDAEANVAPIGRILQTASPVIDGKEYKVEDTEIYEAIRPYYTPFDEWPAFNVEDPDFLATLNQEALLAIVMRVLLCRHRALFRANEVALVADNWNRYSDAFMDIVLNAPYGRE